jgi:hypothetical protein
MRQTFNPKSFVDPKLNLSHEELARVLAKMYPGTLHGVDYLVAHRVDPTTDGRVGGAQIMAWNLPDVVPTIDNEVAAAWEIHGATIRKEMAGDDVRKQRRSLLADADVLVNKAHDSMNRQALVKAMAYRQALRDITKQEGFPDTVVWPDKPV